MNLSRLFKISKGHLPEINRSLSEDAKTGGFFYILDLTIMYLLTDFSTNFPKESILIAVSFVSTAIIRFTILKKMATTEEKATKLFFLFFLTCSIASFTMGMRSIASFSKFSVLGVSGFVCYLGLTTFTTGMITSFRANFLLMSSQITLTLLPGTLYLLLAPVDGGTKFGAILGLFLLYILYQGALSYKNWSDLSYAKQTLTADRGQLITFIDEIPGYVAWLSKDLNISGANARFMRLLNANFGKIPTVIKAEIDHFISMGDEAMYSNVKVEIEEKARIHSLHIKTYQYKDQRFLFLIMTDIEDEVMAKEHLEIQRAASLNSARLSSLGEMAGGIAHEINNPLAIILGRTRQLEVLFERKLKPILSVHAPEIEQEVMKTTQSISNTVDRITKIVKGLREFARDGSKDLLVKTSAKSIVEDTLTFCGEKFKSQNVLLEIDISSEDLFVNCQIQQISQVLLNLLNNSFDAISSSSSSSKKIMIKIQGRDNHVQFSVSDFGEGIKDPQKLFQAFYTTKPVGVGTGIGLSISFGIIRQHGGNLFLESQKNPTTFCFELPAA